MKDLQLSGRSSAEFSSRILKLATSPLTILHTDLSSFLQANSSKPKNLPGRSRPFFDSVAFLHQRHLGLPDKNTTDFVKKYQFEQGAQLFLIPPFFGGGFNRVGYIEMGSQKDPKRHHPSIHPAAGEKDWHVTASPSWNPVRSVDPLSTKN